MINPGLIYLGGGIGLYFLKEEVRPKAGILVSIAALFYIYSLPINVEGSIVSFLDFELILFSVDKVSRFIGLVFGLASLTSLVYSFPFVERKYYFLAYIYIGSAVSLLFVGDLFSFYIFWELMTITSYFLLLSGQTSSKSQNSYYYFIMHVIGALSLLGAILLRYNISGSIALAQIEKGVPLVMIAVGIKMAFIGLHTWLPKNYSQVSFPISLLLSAYTTKVGVYALYRLVGPGKFIAYAGVICAFVGVMLALLQTDIRRVLSYHLIGQVGFMVVGLGLGTELGKVGAFTHLWNHVVYKGLLFMVAGVLIYSAGESDLKKIGGAIEVLPWTAVCGVIGALAISGFPFFNSYMSKLLIKEASTDLFIRGGLYLTTLLTALDAVLKIVYLAFFSPGEVECKRKPTRNMKLGMSLLAVLVLIIGFRPALLTEFLGFEKQVYFYSLYNIRGALEPVFLGGIIFWMSRKTIVSYLKTEIEVDPYSHWGRSVFFLGSKISKVHNGNLSRYVFWMAISLILVWGLFLY